MDQIKLYNVERIVSLLTDQTKTVRKHCNADNFIRVLRRCFQAIPDHRQVSKTNISLDDALMSAYALFRRVNSDQVLPRYSASSSAAKTSKP